MGVNEKEYLCEELSCCRLWKQRRRQAGRGVARWWGRDTFLSHYLATIRPDPPSRTSAFSVRRSTPSWDAAPPPWFCSSFYTPFFLVCVYHPHFSLPDSPHPFVSSRLLYSVMEGARESLSFHLDSFALRYLVFTRGYTYLKTPFLWVINNSFFILFSWLSYGSLSCAVTTTYLLLFLGL